MKKGKTEIGYLIENLYRVRDFLTEKVPPRELGLHLMTIDRAIGVLRELEGRNDGKDGDV